jgi:hypothetical protein
MHLFPGFSGLLVGLVLFFGLWLTACLATPAGSFSHGVIAASVVSLLALLLAPVFLIRFRKKWVAAFTPTTESGMLLHSRAQSSRSLHGIIRYCFLNSGCVCGQYALLPVAGAGDSKIRTTQSLAPRNFLLGAGIVCW